MSKHTLLDHLLNEGPVLINCDGRRCVLPEHLRERANLRLLIGRGLHTDITDTVLTEEELSATLAFSTTTTEQYHCILPLTAIYAASLVGAGGAPACSITWWPDVPRDLDAETAAAAASTPTGDAN